MELIVKAAAESSETSEGDDTAPAVHWSEFHRENVYRHVELPSGVDVGKIKAEFKHGLLTIVAPKAAEKPAGKTVEISTAA